MQSSSSRSLVALALLLCALPARAFDPDGDEDARRRDDPWARIVARQKLYGARTAEQQMRILEIAHAEARKLSPSGPARAAMMSGAAVQGSA